MRSGDLMKQTDGMLGPREKRLVLVVEDNALSRQILCAALEEQYEVIQAENGREGLEKLEEYHTELALVLLDVYMPECDGFEFLRRKGAEERYDTVPVIVATASDSREDEIKCLKLGANDFVVKPYKTEIILNRVANMIKLRESASLVNQLTWDRVTGLYSKEFFYRAVEGAFASSDGEFDLVCSDVENFKSLNDRYGEDNCDTLLNNLATRITSALPELVAGGRIGADKFAFLIGHQQHGWEEALTSISDGLPLANVNVKFGELECVDHTMAVPTACNRAMIALETIKGRHDVMLALFDDDLYQRQAMEQVIRESMESALGELQFTVHYQPKYDVRSNSIGGAEALVRWSHPEIGFISPGFFIPIFERNGFITKLDLYVWEEACREVKRCKELGLPSVPISVNLSRLDFDVPDLAEQIAALADKHGVDHSLLGVELTESAYADNPDAVINVLKQLKGMGFTIELDDFGAGYSSLISLNMLPLDVMKLDMSMIRQATELGDFRIVESAIKLAQLLGLRTVVEGVETSVEAEKVKEMGCDLIQGYYYSKPLCREDFEAYLVS